MRDKASWAENSRTFARSFSHAHSLHRRVRVEFQSAQASERSVLVSEADNRCVNGGRRDNSEIYVPPGVRSRGGTSSRRKLRAFATYSVSSASTTRSTSSSRSSMSLWLRNTSVSCCKTRYRTATYKQSLTPSQRTVSATLVSII